MNIVTRSLQRAASPSIAQFPLRLLNIVSSRSKGARADTDGSSELTSFDSDCDLRWKPMQVQSITESTDPPRCEGLPHDHQILSAGFVCLSPARMIQSR
jgi:hypothetical protein